MKIKISRLLIITSLLLLLSTNVHAVSIQDNREDLKARVDELFTSWDKSDSPGMAVVAVHDGQVIYKNEFGSANLEYGIPISSSTVFHIASVSKHFTAFCIAFLAKEGRLSLDDDVTTFLQDIPDFGETITIRHLINHTSGLRDQWVLFGIAGVRLDDVITTDHILKMVKHQKELNFRPGTEVEYCNTGYTLLAEIVKSVSGKSTREFARKNIFDPLGMSNTQFYDNHQIIVKNRAYPYFISDEEEIIKGNLNYSNVGATSVFTTTDDLVKWITNFDEAKVGGQELFELMFAPGPVRINDEFGYGLGLVITEFRGHEFIFHSGFDAGYRAYLAYFPKLKFGIAILANFPVADPNLRQNAIDIFLDELIGPDQPVVEESEEANAGSGEANESKQEFTLSAQELMKYTGDFYSEELETKYHIIARNGELVITHIRNDDVILVPVSRELFEGDKWWIGSISFVCDSEGKVEGFRVTTAGVKNLYFTKM